MKDSSSSTVLKEKAVPIYSYTLGINIKNHHDTQTAYYVVIWHSRGAHADPVGIATVLKLNARTRTFCVAIRTASRTMSTMRRLALLAINKSKRDV